MRLYRFTQSFCAGVLTLLGFSACLTDQPDLYGPPVLYGPLPDTTEVKQESISRSENDSMPVAPNNHDETENEST